MNRTIWIGILATIVLIAGGWWYFGRLVTPAPPEASQLTTELSKVVPQFIEYREDANARQILPINLEKIRQDVIAVLLPNNDIDFSQRLSLIAVGARYLVIGMPGPEANSPTIFDSATLKSAPILGLYQFTVGKTQVYVSATDICTYTLDTPSCTPVPGAKLTGNEMYGDDSGLAGYFVPQDLDHTNTSMTIAVLAWTSPGTDQAKLQKVRDVTLPLP